jgi:hypothetical protein
MRRADSSTENDTGNTGYTFHFQISTSGSRQACSVRVQAPSHKDATHFFRQNWPAIEAMARENLANASAGSGPLEIDSIHAASNIL